MLYPIGEAMSKYLKYQIIATNPPFRKNRSAQMISLHSVVPNRHTPSMCKIRAIPLLKYANSLVITHTCLLSADNGKLIMILNINLKMDSRPSTYGSYTRVPALALVHLTPLHIPCNPHANARHNSCSSHAQVVPVNGRNVQL